ncbi:MAG: flavin reductase family protein, partial [Sphaerochaetaceae bacterium]|nr:flavin reductase family protein [Sphaerochaetaceae bacterium]
MKKEAMKKEAMKKNSLGPRPNILVSCKGKDGRENALAVAYAGICSYDPPMLMVGIVPSRFSY